MEKKLILGTLGGGIASTLIGGLIFAVVLADQMKAWTEAAGSCANQEVPLLPGLLANFVMAFLLSILLNRSNVSTFQGGLLTAGWIAFLIILWFDLWMFASFSIMTPKLMAMDLIGNTVTLALSGGVIGWIFGKVK